MIESVCQKYNVDPYKKGWTIPRPSGQPVAFTPTPELVHGVSVSNPTLAKILRGSGLFSGKAIKQNLPMGNETHLTSLQEHHKRLQDQKNQVE